MIINHQMTGVETTPNMLFISNTPQTLGNVQPNTGIVYTDSFQARI